MLSHKLNSGINGEAIIPGDKSISHRSVIIPSISNGICEVDNILKSDDVMHTINAFISMGIKIEEYKKKIIIHGKGLHGLKKPLTEIYLGNSGTSARLLIGLLASQNFKSILTGDESLSSRPMQRISEPLMQMGGKIKTTNNSLPIYIDGNELNSSDINIDIPSAQIKSGLLLAALKTKGITKIIENNITRDHTEIMLEAFNANIKSRKDDKIKIITIEGNKEMTSKNIDVPSDLSSSSFFIVAALINKNSKLDLKNININPTRNGILLALKKMGARINLYNERYKNNEVICDIEVLSSELNGCELDSEMAKLMIDEYPILSVAACFANSPSIFRGLNELRVKESDRLNLIYLNLQKCGVKCKIDGDDLFIYPEINYKIQDQIIKTDFDHRIAMAFTIMASKIGSLKISESECINTSFPTFINEFKKTGGIIS